MSCHRTIVVINGRAHCFHKSTYKLTKIELKYYFQLN